MAKNARDRRPAVKPVEKIELDEKNKKLRGILAAVFLVIGLIAIGFFIFSLLNKESGWTEIEPSGSETGAADQFSLYYNLGASGAAASAEYKKIAALYGEVTDKYFKLLHEDELYPGINNIAYINSRPNEEIEVLSELYECFERLLKDKDRTLYLGALNQQYDSLFASDDDVWAGEFDPYLNDESAAFYKTIVSFASDSECIELLLLGENKVKLSVSESYLDFAEKNAITEFISFGNLANAFIVDEIAEALLKEGFGLGTVSSYDGYTRNFDTSKATYSFDVWDKFEDTAYPAAVMKYEGSLAMINYRAYAISAMDSFDYYTYRDGRIAHSYLDIGDGKYKAATDNLLVSSNDLSCAELALKTRHIFISDDIDSEAFASIREAGIGYVYFDGSTVHKTQDVKLEDLYSDENVTYRISENE
ncbi:MAG: hypothetical protein IJY18_06690 [Clostridia bacterium]|nr:hypothetical protein [Clostridia bacterium]